MWSIYNPQRKQVGDKTMKRIGNYFKGVFKEGKRIKWPKKDIFLPAVAVVISIAIFAAVFLVLEDYASGILVAQLRDAFESLRG